MFLFKMFYGHEKEFRSYEESKKSYSLDTTMRESWHVSAALLLETGALHPSQCSAIIFFRLTKGFKYNRVYFHFEKVAKDI